MSFLFYIVIATYLQMAAFLVGTPSIKTSSDLLIESSRFMSRPYMWTRAKLARLYSPFTPSAFGQNDSLVLEGIERNLLAYTLWHTLPLAATVGELAPIPRYLSYEIRETPFHKIHGAIPKKVENPDQFTLMSLNICFLPGELPLLFGGVSEARKRVKPLINLIKKEDPDMLSLYEAHEVDSIYALYEGLKENYAFFYIDIGPDFMEFNSGLFIASKYELDEVNFKPFQYLGMQEQINKGYFEFTVKGKETPLAKIYATHLQPYRKKSDTNIRLKELEEIVQDIQGEFPIPPTYPILVTGDFNIPWGSEEYTHSLIGEHFIDTYGESVAELDEATRTYSAQLGDKRWNSNDIALLETDRPNPYFEIVDYVLLMQPTQHEVHTVRVETFDTEMPTDALCDHHGLFSTIILNDTDSKK